jgi:succinoglycan biosynthesis protein ExoM
MSENKQHIDICIASYKRPQLLAKLLAGLAEQKLPEGVGFAVIVVDNDVAGSAREVVENAFLTGLQVRYFMQPEKNIALTRNLGVANSTGEYIAFIDDDEFPIADWLRRLYETLHTYKADVVFGPVIGEIPPGAPAWIAQGHFFERERYKTGTVSPIRGTGNVLLRAELILDRHTPFNPKYGLSGGEDTDFFRRLQDRGCKFIWCDEAVVVEPVVADRLSVDWLMRRAFRGGRIFAEIYVKPKGVMKKIPWFIYRATLAMIALMGGLLTLPLRKAWGVKCFQKLASNIGQLSSLFHYRYDKY